MQNIAKGNISVVIKAAGDYRTVAKDTNLIPQAVAEKAAGVIRGSQIRPVEFFTVFQEYPIPDADTFGGFPPGFWEALFHFLQYDLILGILPAFIPEPVNDQKFPL